MRLSQHIQLLLNSLASCYMLPFDCLCVLFICVMLFALWIWKKKRRISKEKRNITVSFCWAFVQAKWDGIEMPGLWMLDIIEFDDDFIIIIVSIFHGGRCAIIKMYIFLTKMYLTRIIVYLVCAYLCLVYLIWIGKHTYQQRVFNSSGNFGCTNWRAAQ